jgi:hypothetical protein
MTPKEPKPLTNARVVFDSYDDVLRRIYFWTDKNTAKEFSKFGDCHEMMTRGEFVLKLSPRYDAREVVAYIKNYG